MLKLIIITVLIIEIINATTSDDSGNLIPGQLISKQLLDHHTCPGDMNGPICAEDCTTLLTCARGTTIPAEIRTCSHQGNMSQPYCIPGARACTAAGDPTISSCSASHSHSTFPCTNFGYFPDPKDCQQYHVCTEQSVKSYECPPQYVYDAANYKCKRRRYFRDCSRINCARSQNKYVVYPARKSYYGFCGSNDDIIMFRCSDTDYHEFNPVKVDCEFVCKADGTYPNYENEQLFYECYRSRGRLVSRIQSCPDAYVFNRRLKLCVKEMTTTKPPATEPTIPDTTIAEDTTELSTPGDVESPPIDPETEYLAKIQTQSDPNTIPKKSTLIDWLLHSK